MLTTKELVDIEELIWYLDNYMMSPTTNLTVIGYDKAMQIKDQCKFYSSRIQKLLSGFNEEQKDYLLESNGYIYNFYRTMYYNLTNYTIISLGWINEHSTKEIKELINLNKNNNKWKIISEEKPSKALKKEIIGELNKLRSRKLL